MGYITFEQYGNENTRFHQVGREGTGTGSEEILKTEKSVFARLDGGKMGRSGNSIQDRGRSSAGRSGQLAQAAESPIK